MSSLNDRLKQMSEYLDKSRPSVDRITLNCTRATAMKAGARPELKGGPLRFQGRQVVYTKLTKREQLIRQARHAPALSSP